MDSRGIDVSDPGWINRKFTELQRQIEGLRSERRAAATTIGDGDLRLANGGALVVDGGELLLLDTDGSVLFRAGVQSFGDRGVAIYRDSGLAAIEVTKSSAGLPQAVRIRDSAGNEIISEWPFGTGLGKPYLPMPAYPVTAPAAYGPHGPEVTTTSATWVTLWSMRTTQQNPLWRPRLVLKCSDGTTTAQVRVVKEDGTTLLNDFFTGPSWVGNVPLLSTAYLTHSPFVIIGGAYGADVTRHVQVQVTAGAGTVSLAIPCATGG